MHSNPAAADAGECSPCLVLRIKNDPFDPYSVTAAVQSVALWAGPRGTNSNPAAADADERLASVCG